MTARLGCDAQNMAEKGLDADREIQNKMRVRFNSDPRTVRLAIYI